MKTTVKLRFLMCHILLLMLMVSCKNEGRPDDANSPPVDVEADNMHKHGQAFIVDDASAPNVLKIAMDSPSHSTLVTAIKAADLENALVNAGPLMVFAPTNAAFDELPAGTVNDLLKPENKVKLANILKYHVTPGNYSREFLKNFNKLGQANDQNVDVEVTGDDVYVGGAKIVASIPASNGIIHVVDKVILPPSE
jgi:uncharacterized surface protein with fasciclin (FAS1) repeats